MLTRQDTELLEGHRQVLERVLEKLDRLPDGLRQTLSDHLWASIPETIFEYGWSASGTTITAQPQTASIRRITGILTLAPTGQGATIQIGNTIRVPVPAGEFYMGPVTIIMEEADRATLVSGLFGGTPANAGPIFIGLFGQQLPRFGMMGE